MNRKIFRSQMVGINLRKNLQALISVRVPLETLTTNGKLKFNSNVSKSNFSDSSDNNNNEYKYNYNNDKNNDDKNNSNNNNNSFLIIITIIKVVIKIKFYSRKFSKTSLTSIIMSKRNGSV